MRSSANNNSEPCTSVIRACAAVDSTLAQAIPPRFYAFLRNTHAVQHIDTVKIKLRG
jgi:hypothetical protein